MKKVKRFIEKKCPLCRGTHYMMVEAEKYGIVMNYMVTQWFDAGRKNPTCVAISARSREDAYELILWASEHLEEIRKEHEKGCCYKWKFIEDCIQRGVRTRCQDFLGEGDSVSPFTMG